MVIRRFSSLDKILLALLALGGSLILFFPIQYLLLGLLGLIALIFLLAKPEICFFLVLICSTYVPALSFASRQMPFNQTDILVAICFLGVFLKLIFVHKFRINLRTKIDVWLLFLLLLYFYSGMTSEIHRGYQGFLQFGEILAIYYMTVYFLRSKTLKLSTILKVVLFIGLFQALYGILQSVTGSFGANFQDGRGYLGYIGIGSSIVWHARGTFDHFNSLGPFLTTIFLFYLPINFFIAKNKTNGYIILSILFCGVIMTYSRGSLLALLAGFLCFLFQIQKNKAQFLIKLAPIGIFVFLIWVFLKNTAYVSTLAPRSQMWNIALSAYTQSPKTVLFGYGLKSYLSAAWPYIPTNIPQTSVYNYLAHSFYLNNMVEIGLVGTALLIAFFVKNILTAFKNILSKDKICSLLSVAVVSIVFSILIEGIFDMAFNHFIFQLWLFFMLGIMYSRMKVKKRYE